MRPLSLKRPKALIPTLDVPGLARSLTMLADAGIGPIWVNAHYHADEIAQAASLWGSRLDVKVRVSNERQEPLGTAGALVNLEAELTEPFLMLSADLLTDFPVERLIEEHTAERPAATIMVVRSGGPADFVVDEGSVREVLALDERQRQGHLYGNAGIFEPRLITGIVSVPSGLYESVFLPAAAAGKAIRAIEWNGYWRNVGSPPEHLIANMEALDGLGGQRGIHERLGLTPPDFRDALYIGEGANVDDSQISRSVIGRGALVEPGSKLEGCVVWDGAVVVKGTYSNRVMT